MVYDHWRQQEQGRVTKWGRIYRTEERKSGHSKGPFKDGYINGERLVVRLSCPCVTV
jgi:hypothetical protein